MFHESDRTIHRRKLHMLRYMYVCMYIYIVLDTTLLFFESISCVRRRFPSDHQKTNVSHMIRASRPYLIQEITMQGMDSRNIISIPRTTVCMHVYFIQQTSLDAVLSPQDFQIKDALLLFIRVYLGSNVDFGPHWSREYLLFYKGSVTSTICHFPHPLSSRILAHIGVHEDPPIPKKSEQHGTNWGSFQSIGMFEHDQYCMSFDRKPTMTWEEGRSNERKNRKRREVQYSTS